MILTLFPPTWSLANKPAGKNGTNGVVFAYYWANHPYAAAIAAQEVREGRAKSLFAVPAAILAGVGYWLLAGRYGLPLEFVPFPPLGALLIVALLTWPRTPFPSIARQVEFIGQSVECVVRELYYGTPLSVSVPEAARQFTTYKQFNGWDQLKIETYLLKEIPRARKWAASNRRLIERAKEK